MNRPIRRVKSYRSLATSVALALVVAAACGGNPELSLTNDPVSGGAELGESCEHNQDCASDLLCGPDGSCVRACGSLTGDDCGDEACLDEGRCSEGLSQTCSDDSDCSEGLVCSSFNRCSTPCEPGSEDSCKGGEACRDEGTCPTPRDIMLGIGGAGGEEPPGGTGGSGSCIDIQVEFEPQIPTVLLLIDRSGSMNDAEGFGAAVRAAVDDGSYVLGDCPEDNDWRWNVVRDVLFNPTKGIIKPLEERVRFGMSLYTSDNGRVDEDDREAVDPDKMCPTLIEVPISIGNHQAMFDEFVCSDIADDTPTGESLVAAAETLAAFDEPGPKLIVLATDGEPDTCECPNFGSNSHVPERCTEDGVPERIKDEVVSTAGEIHAQDITVHVINVSTPSNASLQTHLAEVATAGGGEVYPGFSPGALTTAFEAIIDGARSCIIDLEGEIAEGKEDTGTVTLDGEPLELDGEDGWQVNSPSQIELLGSACETIKRGDHDLDIKFPCESFVEPVVH
jgi:hypothetical protein